MTAGIGGCERRPDRGANRLRYIVRFLCVASLLAGAMGCFADSSKPVPPTEYERRELTIPARDGVKLFAVALIPKGSTSPLPVLLVRTPFSAANAFETNALPPMYRELAEDGYIFVSQDIRGRFRSEGTFVVSREQHDPRDSLGTDESTDAFDTVDWLVKNLPGNNGKVGVIGFSYSGWLAALAGVGAHPAVKAISSQGPMTDTWMGDDFFHQGAFRQTSGVVFSALMEIDPKAFHFVSIPDSDHYDFYKKHPTLDSLAKATGVSHLPSWTGYSTHPAYDTYWQKKALQNVLRTAEVPMLFVGGWWDQEDILGAQLAYRTVQTSDSSGKARVVLGPWVHNGWLHPRGDSLGAIALGSNTALHFRQNIQRPWLAYYLHGKGSDDFPEAWAFESGANAWRTFDAWPPKNTRERNLYLRPNGLLSFDSTATPAVQTAADTAHTPDYDAYVSDPANPIPYMPRPVTDAGWRTWLLQDQRFLNGRQDVLTWRSDPLPEDLTIAGNVVAHLFASTTGTDADWVVKLIDVYPDSTIGGGAVADYQLMTNADIMRGRYWKGFTEATPIVANVVTPFTVDLHEQLYRFKKGHRLMVQVQSTWFPLYDRNPQRFVSNIFTAKSGDFRAQTHRIWHSGMHRSHVSVRVLE